MLTLDILHVKYLKKSSTFNVKCLVSSYIRNIYFVKQQPDHNLNCLMLFRVGKMLLSLIYRLTKMVTNSDSI